MNTRTSGRSRCAAVVAALVLGTGLGGLVVPSASALPPGGASPDTPGTSGTVSPRQVAPGATVSFSIAGFPGGEVVSVKIDDGEFCSAKGVHGACVVHQQKSAKDGTLRGSFSLPGDLSAGRHWLRFLASEEMTDDAGNYLGVKPFSLKGDTDFTVVVPGAGGGTDQGTQGPGGSLSGGKKPSSNVASSGPSTAPSTGTGTGSTPIASAPGASAPAAADAQATQAEEAAAGALRVTAPAQPSASPEAGMAPEVATVASTEPAEEPMPWIGLTVLVLCAGAVVGAVIAGRSGRRA